MKETHTMNNLPTLPTFDELLATNPAPEWHGVDLMDHVSNLFGAAAFVKAMSDMNLVLTERDGTAPSPEQLQRAMYDELLPWVKQVLTVPIVPLPRTKIN